MDFRKTLWPVDLFLDALFNSFIFRNSITITQELKELEDDIYKNSFTTLHNINLDTQKMNNCLTPNTCSCFEISSGKIGKLLLKFPQNFLMSKIEIIVEELTLDISLKEINTNYEVKETKEEPHKPWNDYNLV